MSGLGDPCQMHKLTYKWLNREKKETLHIKYRPNIRNCTDKLVIRIWINFIKSLKQDNKVADY